LLPALATVLALALCGNSLLAERVTARPAVASTRPAELAKQPPIELVRGALTYLASDELEGRGIETVGIDEAADFIAGMFAATGVKPLDRPGVDAYFQKFDYTTAHGVDPATALTAAGHEYQPGIDFTPSSFSAEGAFHGPVVFAGYGISNPHQNYDDYANLEVKGKVVLVLRYEPHDSHGVSRFTKKENEWSEAAALYAKAKAAADHGAVALLLVNPPSHHTLEDALMPFAQRFPGERSSIPFLHIKQTVADAILAASHADDLKALQASIDGDGTPHSFPLKDATVSGKVVLERSVRKLKNVIGCIPGSGSHADEFVVVGAHYDHLGRGGFGSLSPRSHDIHHGADDNASGTSAVLALAQHYAGRQSAPARSILFVLFTAEESGLIGSQHFVDHPPVPLEKIVAMVNLDMVGRLREDKVSDASEQKAPTLYVGGGGTAAEFDAILKKADADSPLQLKSIGKGGFGPSDHMSFAMKKVPVLFFFTGLHADYHRPTDTADKINFPGIVQVVDLTAEVIDGLLAMPGKPQYVEANDGPLRIPGGEGPTRRVTLGVIPNYAEEDQSASGVRISGTMPDSPASRAGLKAGDVIVGWDGQKVDTLYDLSDLLAKSKAGQTVKLKYLRNKEPHETEATLVERK